MKNQIEKDLFNYDDCAWYYDNDYILINGQNKKE